MSTFPMADSFTFAVPVSIYGGETAANDYRSVTL